MDGGGTHWSVHKMPIASWVATVPWWDGDDVMASWQDEFLSAGERTEMYCVTDVGSTEFRRDRDGDISTFAARHPHRIERVARWGEPAPFLAVAADGVALTRVSIEDAGGEVISPAIRWFSDLTALSVEWRGRGRVPIGIEAEMAFDEADPTSDRAIGIDFRLVLTADLWLPWTIAAGVPGYEYYDMLDNRRMAALNAPRLNDFLGTVRSATLGVGGRWRREAGMYAFELDDGGVVLDAPDPRRVPGPQ